MRPYAAECQKWVQSGPVLVSFLRPLGAPSLRGTQSFLCFFFLVLFFFGFFLRKSRLYPGVCQSWDRAGPFLWPICDHREAVSYRVARFFMVLYFWVGFLPFFEQVAPLPRSMEKLGPDGVHFWAKKKSDLARSRSQICGPVFCFFFFVKVAPLCCRMPKMGPIGACFGLLFAAVRCPLS